MRGDILGGRTSGLELGESARFTVHLRGDLVAEPDANAVACKAVIEATVKHVGTTAAGAGTNERGDAGF
ncbi:MAG: hypothetical protein ACYDDQ_07465 [Vulcanimicrobiaceae bacterium]